MSLEKLIGNEVQEVRQTKKVQKESPIIYNSGVRVKNNRKSTKGRRVQTIVFYDSETFPPKRIVKHIKHQR
jgi:translation initiation factor 1 (eIF-1/SUI1)